MADSLPRTLSVSYILSNQTEDGAEPASDISDEQVNQFLSENGVEVEEADSPEDCRRVLQSLRSNPTFWVKHYTLHPNAKRVKNWLWVHDRYRAQVDALQALATSLPSFDKDKPTVLQSAAKKLLADYNKFVGKIEKHSEFEDEQLFKFFLNEKIGAEDSTINTSAALNSLTKEHGDVKNVTELQECLQKMIKGPGLDTTMDNLKEQVERKMTDYVDDLKQHLDAEERAIVALWLQLTPAQYKKYRSYLSWKYAMMY